MTEKVKVGLVGCGDIARKAYLPFTRDSQDAYEIVACCDTRRPFAEGLAAEFAIPKVYDVPERLLEDPDIELVLNLTHPAGHAPINLAALQAGKHAYCEKPFALSLEEGRAVLAEAEERGLLVGCAPDTVLGPGTQACRKIVEDGSLGRVTSAKLQCTGAGHEHWHPNPAFYYQNGGGPLLDMGPYYLSFLVQTLGPVRRVQGRALQSYAERPIRCGEQEGKMMKVEVPTLYMGSLETASGVPVSMLFSFDHPYGCSGSGMPEIFFESGAMIGTNPNRFDGLPKVNSAYAKADFEEINVGFDYPSGRGLGLVDMVQAIREGRPPRASGEMAYHILEVMLAFEESEKRQTTVEIESSCAVPAPMPKTGTSAK